MLEQPGGNDQEIVMRSHDERRPPASQNVLVSPHIHVHRNAWSRFDLTANNVPILLCTCCLCAQESHVSPIFSTACWPGIRVGKLWKEKMIFRVNWYQGSLYKRI